MNAIVVGTLLSACLPRRERTPALRVGINAWPGYEALFLAQEKGYYREAGLAVRIVEFSSLVDARRAYERGQIDVLAATPVEVLQARDQSARSPQIVQVVDFSNGADVILGRAALHDPAALRGAKVGVELASLGAYILARGLAKYGLGLEDVEKASIDQLSMEAEFRRGELDAVVTYPPTSVKLMRDAQAHELFSTREIPGEVVDVIAVEEAVNRQRGGDVAKLLHAFHRALDYTRAHPSDAYAIMAAREGITSREFEAAVSQGMTLVGADRQREFLAPSGCLQTVIDTCDRVLRQTGQITGPDRRAGIVTDKYVHGGNPK